MLAPTTSLRWQAFSRVEKKECNMLSMFCRLVALNPQRAIVGIALASALIYSGVSQHRLRACQHRNEILTLQADLMKQAQRHYTEELERRAVDVGRGQKVIARQVRVANEARTAAGDDWNGSRRAVVGLLNVLSAGESGDPTPLDCPPTVAGYTPARGCND